jgi:hypothetical protein
MAGLAGYPGVRKPRSSRIMTLERSARGGTRLDQGNGSGEGVGCEVEIGARRKFAEDLGVGCGRRA